MRSSILSSILLHIIILMLAIVTLPIFNSPDLEIPPIVQVELIEISEKTNVPKASIKQDEKEDKKVEEKEIEKINQPVMKPKIEKSNEKVNDPSENEEIVKSQIEQQMFENIPIKKPVIKKKDKFDPLKIAELIDKSKNTKTVEENIDDLEYDALDSTPSLDNRLTLSEEDAIRAQFIQCWSVPMGIPYDDTMIVKIKISLNTDGSLLEPPEVLQHERMNKPSEKYFRTLAESALRAVRICDPIIAPDIDRYESWKIIQLNFDPRELLRG